MIKSRHRTFGFWLLVLFSAFFGLLVISAAAQYKFGYTLVKMQLGSDKEYYIQTGLALFIMLLALSILGSNVKNISIDSNDRSISFQNIITRVITTYNFQGFNGYIDTFIKHGKGGRSYKAIGLVKGKRIVRRIDSYYYSNFDELREALANCNYLGEVRLGFWNRLKMLFNYEVLE